MIRPSIRIIPALLAAASLVAAAQAQPPAGSAMSKNMATGDPNERICRDIATSSRIATRRYCATRAEWQEFEQREQQQVQLMQRPLQGCQIMGMRHC